jgi:hypothetical protein
MALSENEIKISDTLQLLTKLVKTGFPVGYARIASWHINPGDPSFVAVLSLYLNEECRQENPLGCSHFEIGCTLTPEALEFLTQADDRNLLYKAIEFIVHYQIFEQTLLTIMDKAEAHQFVEEKNAVLAELNDELGIGLSTNFKLNENSIGKMPINPRIS